jgi:hypothetical protein
MGAGEVIASGIAAVVLAAILCSLAVVIAVWWTQRHPLRHHRPGRPGVVRRRGHR